MFRTTEADAFVRFTFDDSIRWTLLLGELEWCFCWIKIVRSVARRRVSNISHKYCGLKSKVDQQRTKHDSND